MSFDRLTGVIDDIQKDLLHLVRVHHYFWQVGRQLREYFDVAGAKLVLEKLNCTLDEFIDALRTHFQTEKLKAEAVGV